jgi:hypothetical protein
MLTEHELQVKELALKTQELDLKNRELELGKKKPNIFFSPLLLTMIVAILGIFGNLGLEAYKAGQAREAKSFDTALELIKAAAASGHVEQVRTNLKFIIDVELAPDSLRSKLNTYLSRPDAPLPGAIGQPTLADNSPTGGVSPRVIAAVVQQAQQQQAEQRAVPMVPVVPAPPPTTASPAPPPSLAAAPPPPRAPIVLTTGWIYLGKTTPDDTRWEKSSADGSLRFPDLPAGAKISAELIGKTIETTSSKFLREGGPPGRKVQSAIKETLRPGSKMRVKSIDNIGRDEGMPVVWAEVEVTAPAGAQ